MRNPVSQIKSMIKVFYTTILFQTTKGNINVAMFKPLLTGGLWKKLIFYTILFLCASGALASAKSQIKLVDWHFAEGLVRLGSSSHKADFPHLSNQFQNQLDGITCGPTTGAIVLNALRIGKRAVLPKTSFNEKYKTYLPKIYDPRVGRYTPESFMNEKAQKIKSWPQIYGQPIDGINDFGLQIRQLHKIFLIHGVKSKLRVVDKNLSDQFVKQELISNLSKEGDYIVVNYKRSALGQKGGGHISPLGAYDENTDSFLIMDVNSSRYNWVWVKTEDMIKAMRTFDTVENRGYLLIGE